MPNIHFYDTDTGYIHYVSDVIAELECRVYDAVRSFEDASIDYRNAVQFVPNSYGNVTLELIHEHGFRLILEALSVSRKGVTFMDRIMKNSPFRNNNAWLIQPDGRSLFMAERKKRLVSWRMNGEPIAAGKAEEIDDVQHPHGGLTTPSK